MCEDVLPTFTPVLAAKLVSAYAMATVRHERLLQALGDHVAQEAAAQICPPEVAAELVAAYGVLGVQHDGMLAALGMQEGATPDGAEN